MANKKKEKKIVIQVGKEKGEITLAWENAPNMCKTIWDNLPLQATGTHAKIVSHELMFMLPIVMERENMQDVTPGIVGWWGNRSCVNIWYDKLGKLGPAGQTAVIGRVTKNLEGIGRESKKTWIKPGMAVKLEKGTD